MPSFSADLRFAAFAYAAMAAMRRRCRCRHFAARRHAAIATRMRFAAQSHYTPRSTLIKLSLIRHYAMPKMFSLAMPPLMI